MGALLVATSASALTFNWTFTPTESTGSLAPISGTITGLVEGNNSGAGTTVLITQSTFSHVHHSFDFGFTFSDNAFVVTSGAVTYADAVYFGEPSQALYMSAFGGGFYPELSNPEYEQDATLRSGVVTFSTYSATPEPASWALMIGGFGLTGAALSRRRRVTSAP